jgi:2,3-bisphosphoglycerate-independent phosphoglycerate mutase
MSVIFIFIDGIGYGEDKKKNPFTNQKLSFFKGISNGSGLTNKFREIRTQDLTHIKIDANLDVEGLPQSGTGQTSLFTGINASKIVGRHFGPYPHSKIRPHLENGSIFHKVLSKGYKPYFMNAYPDIFFKKSEKRNRWSCTTLMVKSAGLRLNRLDDLIEERALTAGITQETWREMLDLNVPEITSENAADRILKVAEEYDFVLYEYYLTDKAGHKKSKTYAVEVLEKLDRFLFHLNEEKKEDQVLVISSDHGNLENLDIKTHTRNPVPLIISGAHRDCNTTAESITDVSSTILKILDYQSGLP